jgi:CheY-like chemotaxis protein
LPHLLLVDDSEAILAYEKAALAGHYTLSTAPNGAEGLKKAAEIQPAAMLLDLSMPEMSGDEVLTRLKADAALRHIPVIIVSSEKERAEGCLKIGAAAYLPKPIRADELRVLVGRVLEAHQQAQRQGSLSVLALRAGPIELGIALDSVRMVLDQPATLPLPAGPSYLQEMFDLHGQPICILNLARRLGVQFDQPITERKLVVVENGDQLLALAADSVRDPEEFTAEDVVPRQQLGGADHGPLGEILKAVVKTPRGPLTVIEPKSLMAKELLRELPSLLRQVSSAGEQAP